MLFRSRIYTANHLPRTPRIDGIGDVIDELAQHFFLSVVTAKPVNQAIIAVDALGMTGLFETVIGPQPDKPTPKARLLEDALTFIENKQGTRPRNDACWMIGDRHHDIDAATEVGTRSVGVLWGYGDEAELTAAGATAIARVPADLLTILL